MRRGPTLPLLALCWALALPAPGDAIPLPERLRALGLDWDAVHHDEEKGDGGSIPHEGGEPHACESGRADIFRCRRVDLEGFVSLAEMGGSRGNDVWGWADPKTGREYALTGHTHGTAFIDVTDPGHPLLLAVLPTETNASTWRDIKVYRHFALIVADSAAGHGMQILNLRKLRRLEPPTKTIRPTAVYTQFGSAHNLAVDVASGFAYAVGTDTCQGGLHMIDLAKPRRPRFAGCFEADGYTHDTQCVIYDGPDAAFRGRQLCFAANEDTLTVVDVTDKQEPLQVSRTSYEGVGYAHQGWLSEDHAWFFLDDELDERRDGHKTRTLVWDLADLTAPTVAGLHFSRKGAIDHNQYVFEGHLYQANYTRGLQVLRIEDAATGDLKEVARFDTHPENDAPTFDGAWSVYPFFGSGIVLVNDINRGLFVLRPRLPRR